MSDGFSWKRLLQAARDVFLPWRGIREVWGQVVAWFGILGLTAFATVRWADVLPPSWRGKLLFGALFLLVIGLGISAAYRLRSQLDDRTQRQRSARDEQRHAVAVSIFSLAAAHKSLIAAASERSQVPQAGGTPEPIPEEFHTRMASSLDEYAKLSRRLGLHEASIHQRLHIEVGAALAEHDFGRLSEAIDKILTYLKRFKLSESLDSEEEEAIETWAKDIYPDL